MPECIISVIAEYLVSTLERFKPASTIRHFLRFQDSVFSREKGTHREAFRRPFWAVKYEGGSYCINRNRSIYCTPRI